jgi:hypothetical protein
VAWQCVDGKVCMAVFVYNERTGHHAADTDHGDLYISPRVFISGSTVMRAVQPLAN